MARRPLVRPRERGGFGRPFLFGALTALLVAGILTDVNAESAPRQTLRIATYNASLYRSQAGELHRDLSVGTHPQIRDIAAVIQRVRPDVLLINEFDYDERAPALFVDNYLGVSQRGSKPLRFADHFVAPSNTGVPSGFDLDRSGRIEGGNDALGFGRFPGQYGMLVLSNLPIDRTAIRTFRRFLWRDMPGALLPPGWYSPAALEALPLSSKSHWDIPLRWGKTTLHLLASHPTPPGFDGPENRNGRRNHDEIRLWADYLDPAQSTYLVDDAGRRGGLDPEAPFAIAGDLNADPEDGGSLTGAIHRLLHHPRIHREAAVGARVPRSIGAIRAAETQHGQNLRHRGSPERDTADFGDRGENAPGNLRVDYVLPSAMLTVCASGVEWPADAAPDDPIFASDHRLVWVDIAPPGHDCRSR